MKVCRISFGERLRASGVCDTSTRDTSPSVPSNGPIHSFLVEPLQFHEEIVRAPLDYEVRSPSHWYRR